MKGDQKKATDIQASMLESKTDLANLTTNVENLDVGKLQTVFQLINLVDNDAAKRTVYN